MFLIGIVPVLSGNRIETGWDDPMNGGERGSVPSCARPRPASVPGTGKTSLQRWWLCQIAAHPAVQLAVLDGKVSDPADGDYGQLIPRCFTGA